MAGVTSEFAFEEAIEQTLLNSGWTKADPAGYDRALGLFPRELVEFLRGSQPDEWEQLCSRHGGDAKARTKVVRRVADEITKRGVVDVLRRGVKDSGVTVQVAYFAPAHDLTPTLRTRYDANRLAVSRQVHHSESNPQASLDMVLAVNGIPTATAELKNPLTRQSVEHAIAQYRSNRNETDLIFRARVVVNFAVDPEQVYMTTRLAGKDTVFLPFNQGSRGPGEPGGQGNPLNPDGYQTSYLWERVWARDAWLGILENFVHVEDVVDDDGSTTGKPRTLFPRFHQWDLVERLMSATVATGPGVNRLVQHSAGSGKSNSIAWTAHRLSRLHTPGFHGELTEQVRNAGLGINQPIFHKVIVITDRRVLDRQLQATVAGFDHTPGTVVKIDRDSGQLRDALGGNTARIIITTLQKFPVVAEHASKVAGQRFAVIIDEAHSSASGEGVKDLKKVLTQRLVDEDDALAAAEYAEVEIEAGEKDATDLLAESMTARGRHENLAFFAFTATPKPKTLELFGESLVGPDGVEVFKPFHTYSMRQAIEEGYILDVLANYTTYATYWNVGHTDPDHDIDVPVGKASTAIGRFVSLHPSNLAQRAEIIVEHFRTKTAGKIGGHAKAMVVTRSRLHAVKYKIAIDAYIERKGYDKGAHPLRALVAFSGTVVDPTDGGQVAYTEAMMNAFPETHLPKRFASDDYQVLVVAEKYQTGFDQPLLHSMFVDKPLSGVKAVQTLSRLNRIHPGKVDTFVLDFANRAEDILESFKPFYEMSTALPTDPNVLYAWQRALLDAGVLHPDEMHTAVTALLAGGPGKQQTVYANLNTAVARFVDLPAEGQETFRTALKGYLRGYAFLAQVMSWTDPDLERLYLYGRALQPMLPAEPGTTLPSISEAVLLTHLRIEQTSDGALALEATGEPGRALINEGEGKKVEEPTEPLSQLIAALNQRFGMDLTDADKVWFEQQKQAVKDSDEARVVALNNDADQYRVFLDTFIENAIIDRHLANGVLFNAFNDKPEFREMLLAYIATSYDEFRAKP